MKTDETKENKTSRPILPAGIGLFHERLKVLIGEESVRAFGRKVGISDTTLRKYLSGDTEPTITRLVAISRVSGVQLEWLATGEGDKFAQDTATNITLPPISKSEFDEEYELIDGYHVSVSAGHGMFGCENSPVKRRLAFRTKWLKYKGLSANQLKVVFAKGDSMEPTIKSGDSLLVNLDSTKPLDGQIFVVRLGDELYAKRIQKCWNGSIELISDNKDYERQTIPPSELEHLCIIGQVVWIGKDVA